MTSRLRFSTEDDLCLLKQVLGVNPFETSEKWKHIHERVVQITNKKFTLRALKDHLDHLMKLFAKDDRFNLKKTGTEEQYEEKKQLLQEITKLHREFKNTPSLKIRKTQENEALKWETDGHNTTNLKVEYTNETVPEIVFENDPLLFNLDHGNPKLGMVSDANSSESSSCSSSSKNFVLLPNNNKCKGPIRHRKKRNARKKASLEFLRERHQIETALKEKELALEEKRLAIEERKLALEEARLQMEQQEREHKMVIENEERRYRMALTNQQQKIIDALLEQINKK